MIPNWVRRQIVDLVDEWVTDPPALIGIDDQDSLILGTHMKGGGVIRPIGSLAPGDGFIWTPAGGKRLPQLWLAPLRSDYRTIFEQFAIRELGAPGLAGTGLHIDHVFPKRAAALGEMGYVRMLAVAADSNMSAGRTLEKQMVARNAAFGARIKPTRTATPAAIGKATGFAGYEHLPDDDGEGNMELARALLTHLRDWGVPDGVLQEHDLLATAHTLGRLR
jgi:hypothetical protein